jgi:hypothetical protein
LTGSAQILSLQNNGDDILNFFKYVRNGSHSTFQNAGKLKSSIGSYSSIYDKMNLSFFNAELQPALTIFFHDSFRSSLDDALVLDDDKFSHNMNKLKDLWNRFSSDILATVPLHSHIYVEDFENDLPISRFASRLFKLLNGIVSLVEESIAKMTIFSYELIAVGLQIIISLSEMPVHFPFVTSMWKKVIAPGAGDLNLLHFFSLLGSCVSTWSFRLYWRGASPLSVHDITALETTRDPTQFFYVWTFGIIIYSHLQVMHQL